MLLISTFELSLDFYEIHCIIYVYFYVDIDVLYLGGPELCQGGFPSNFTFDDNISPRIVITLCGVPQPLVEAELGGQKLDVIDTTSNNYTHNFTLVLPLLTQKICGRELQIKASGYNGTLTDKTKIFLRNCKYDYYVHIILFLSYF